MAYSRETVALRPVFSSVVVPDDCALDALEISRTAVSKLPDDVFSVPHWLPK